jgi:ribosomal-protein-alanine N-acetyltransferase
MGRQNRVEEAEGGQGLAPEAVAAVVRYGFSVLGLHRIEAAVLPGNEASVRVLQKLGFREEGTRRDYLYAKGRFHSFRWFSLLATDTERASWSRRRPVMPHVNRRRRRVGVHVQPK